MHAPSNKTRRWLFYVMKIFIRLLHMWCRVGFLASGSALFSTSSALCASRLTRRAQPNRHPTRRLTWRGDPCPSAPRPTSDMMVSNSSRPGNAIQALGLLAEGVKQTKGCMDRCTAEAGLLVVFDRAPEHPGPTRSSGARRRELAHRSRSGECSAGRDFSRAIVLIDAGWDGTAKKASPTLRSEGNLTGGRAHARIQRLGSRSADDTPRRQTAQ